MVVFRNLSAWIQRNLSVFLACMGSLARERPQWASCYAIRCPKNFRGRCTMLSSTMTHKWTGEANWWNVFVPGAQASPHHRLARYYHLTSERNRRSLKAAQIGCQDDIYISVVESSVSSLYSRISILIQHDVHWGDNTTREIIVKRLELRNSIINS